MGERQLSKVQYGKEVITTHGPAVNATMIINMASIAIPDDRVPVFPPVNVGIRARSFKPVVYGVFVQNTLQFPYGYYQILPMIFSCGLKGNVTATETTPSQADWKWTFAPSETASNTIDSVTLEYGDDVQAFETEYVMFEAIRISGEIAQDTGESPVAIEADFFGRQVTATSFTGALSLTSPEYINAKTARFYLDTSWAGVGGTEKTNTLRAFEIEILTGVHAKMLGTGNKYFDIHGEGAIDVMGTLTFEENSSANAIWTAHHADPPTLQAIRLSCSGAQIGTGTNHNIKIDIGGIWTEVIPLASEDNGNNLTTAIP